MKASTTPVRPLETGSTNATRTARPGGRRETPQRPTKTPTANETREAIPDRIQSYPFPVFFSGLPSRGGDTRTTKRSGGLGDDQHPVPHQVLSPPPRSEVGNRDIESQPRPRAKPRAGTPDHEELYNPLYRKGDTKGRHPFYPIEQSSRQGVGSRRGFRERAAKRGVA